MRATAYQHIGARTEQQDCYLCDLNRRMFLVADGMGGHAMGAEAAQAAVDSLRQWGRRSDDKPDGLWLALQCASEAVCKLAPCLVTGTTRHKMSCDCDKPGSTLTGLWWFGDVPVLGHVGDSRCYLLTAAGSWMQVSTDHKWGRALSQCLGRNDIDPQIVTLQPQPGATWLLCSDGLTDALKDGELCALLSRGADAEALVDAALAKGRERQDNITAVVVHG